MPKLIFGCGYLGSRVAQRWRDSSERVFVVTRSQASAEKFARQGYSPLVADVLDRSSLVDLPHVDTVLYAVGYDRAAVASMHDVFVSGLRNVLDALPDAVKRFIYISSTGVYGQSHDELVDELSACEPTREGGRACLAAEHLLADHRLNANSIVLRMAGLYGPGRVPHLAEIRSGEPMAVPQTGFLNLIHVDDAAAVVIAAAQRAAEPRLYAVSDGNPVERRDYFAEIARLLGASPPRFAPPAADSPAAPRAASSKRVSNARLLAELSTTFQYPTYRDGLSAILAAQAADK